MRFAKKLLLSAAVFALCSCGTLNPFAEKGKTANAPAELLPITPKAKVQTVWSTVVGAGKEYEFVPAKAGDSIYAASSDGTLMKVDAATGRTVWKAKAEVPLTSGVGASEDAIAVVGKKGLLLVYGANGSLKWKAQLSSEALSSPAVGNGLVIVRDIDNQVAAFDVDSGAKKWTVQRAVPTLMLRKAPGIVVTNENAVIAFPGGRLSSLSLNNGGPRWEIGVGDPRGTTDLERIADISGFPVIQGDDVCAVAFQGRIGCFKLSTGSVNWIKDFSGKSGLAASDKLVVAPDDKDTVVAFNRDTGSIAWKNTQLTNRGLSTPVVIGNHAMVGDYKGFIHVLSLTDGTVVTRMPTDGSAITQSAVVQGSTVIFLTHAGKLIAVSIN